MIASSKNYCFLPMCLRAIRMPYLHSILFCILIWFFMVSFFSNHSAYNANDSHFASAKMHSKITYGRLIQINKVAEIKVEHVWIHIELIKVFSREKKSLNKCACGLKILKLLRKRKTFILTGKLINVQRTVYFKQRNCFRNNIFYWKYFQN